MERRTFGIVFPHLLQIDLGAEPSPNHTQTPTPSYRISDCVVFVQVVFCKTWFYALVRETWVYDLVLQTSSANTVCDALLHRSTLSLYAEDFGATRHSDGGLVARYAFREVYEHAEGGCEAVSRIGDGGRIVCD
jgi:hypothetical protein